MSANAHNTDELEVLRNRILPGQAGRSTLHESIVQESLRSHQTPRKLSRQDRRHALIEIMQTYTVEGNPDRELAERYIEVLEKADQREFDRQKERNNWIRWALSYLLPLVSILLSLYAIFGK